MGEDQKAHAAPLACQTPHSGCSLAQPMLSPEGCLLLTLPVAHKPLGENNGGAAPVHTVLSQENNSWLHRSDFWLTLRDHRNRGDRKPSAVTCMDQGMDLCTRSSASTLFSISKGSRSSSLLSLGWSSQHGPSS